MSDIKQPDIEFEEEAGSSPFSSYEPEVEIFTEGEEPVDEKPEETGPSREDLAAELEQTKQQQELLARQADQNLALQAGLQTIAEKLDRPVQSAQAQAPQITEEEFRKQYNENFIEDPANQSEQFYVRKVGPIVQTLQSGLLFQGRKLAKIEHGDTFNRYESEIDKTVQQMNQSDPEVYEKAYQMVMSQHIDDIRAQDREQMKEEIRKELLAELKPNGNTTPPTQTPGRGSNSPPAKSTKRIVLKREVRAQAELEAARKGMDPKRYIESIYGRQV